MTAVQNNNNNNIINCYANLFDYLLLFTARFSRPTNEYFEMMARYNKQAEFETDIREYIFLSTKALGEDIHAFSDKFDINNADRFIKLENHARSHEKDIKNIERIVENARNQAVNYRVDLGNEILKTNESIGRLTNSVNNLNITLNYIKFELDLPFHRRLWRFFVQWLSQYREPMQSHLYHILWLVVVFLVLFVVLNTT